MRFHQCDINEVRSEQNNRENSTTFDVPLKQSLNNPTYKLQHIPRQRFKIRETSHHTISGTFAKHRGNLEPKECRIKLSKWDVSAFTYAKAGFFSLDKRDILFGKSTFTPELKCYQQNDEKSDRSFKKFTNFRSGCDLLYLLRQRVYNAKYFATPQRLHGPYYKKKS
jgi:hypothetical protein